MGVPGSGDEAIFIGGELDARDEIIMGVLELIDELAGPQRPQPDAPVVVRRDQEAL